MDFITLLVLSYLTGSIPFGKIIAQKRGVDIQKKGSGNIGFTNTARALGFKPAIFVLIGDILKGFIPAKLALAFLSFEQVQIIVLAAVLGHIFPIWLKFKGGKGVATGLGVLIALNLKLTLIALSIFLITFLLTKIVSVSSLLSTWSLPILAYLIYPNLTLFLLTLAIIITLSHRENIARLIKGTENKII